MWNVRISSWTASIDHQALICSSTKRCKNSALLCVSHHCNVLLMHRRILQTNCSTTTLQLWRLKYTVAKDFISTIVMIQWQLSTIPETYLPIDVAHTNPKAGLAYGNFRMVFIVGKVHFHRLISNSFYILYLRKNERKLSKQQTDCNQIGHKERSTGLTWYLEEQLDGRLIFFSCCQLSTFKLHCRFGAT